MARLLVVCCLFDSIHLAFIIVCHFCPNWSKHGEKHPLIIVYLTAKDNLSRRGIVNLSTNLSSLESVLKVKCFMFRNFWTDCCCSSSHLIVCSDFSSSLEANETTSVNLQNETIEVVCFLVSLRRRLHYAKEFENGGFTLKKHQMFSVQTTPEEFKHATITGQFGFVFEENSVREITWL